MTSILRAGLVLALLLASWGTQATVVEYYDPGLDRYFLTADPDEMAFVETGGAGRGWVRTGYEFETAGTCFGNACQVNPVCRFYGTPPRGSGSHFYTANADECALVRDHDSAWTYEGIAFDAYVPGGTTFRCAPGLLPVTRFYNNRFAVNGNGANHRYAWAEAAKVQMSAKGWRLEGNVFCATAVHDQPLRAFAITADGDRVRSNIDCSKDIDTLRTCIGSSNLPALDKVFGPFIAGSSDGDTFAARTGLATGTVYAAAGPAPAQAASDAFVQIADPATFGIHVTTRSRGGATLTNLNPLYQFWRFAPRDGEPEQRLTPWAGQYDTDVEVALSFDLHVKRVDATSGSAAYGHPTLDVFDRRSGLHFYFIVMTFGTVPSMDNVLRDGPSGNVIVSTAFRASPYGRSFGAATMDTPAPFVSPQAEGSGGHFEFHVGRDEFARALAAARTLEPRLSADPADYVFDDYHFNSEIAGDGEIGITLASMGLKLLRR